MKHTNKNGKTMAKFTKQNLINRSGYIVYEPMIGTSKGQKFVARFKYNQPCGSFMTILRKKFTVREYFERLENGETPLSIVESKGYISPHIKRQMKKEGYPLTMEGKQQYFSDYLARWA